MISLKEYLSRCGYSEQKLQVLTKRMKELTAMYPDKVLYTKQDIDAYCGSNKTRKYQMSVIVKYLKMNLKFIDTKKTHKKKLSIADAITKYMAYQHRRNLADSSLGYCLYQLGLFNAYLSMHAITTISLIDKQVISGFKQYLFMKETIHGRRYDVCTQKAILFQVKALCDYLVREGYMTRNPARKLRFPREEKRLSRNHLTKDEMHRFFSAIFTDTIYGFFDRTMFEVFYSTGMRMEEIQDLKLPALMIDENLLSVFNGKGKKDRVCVLTENAKQYLVMYLDTVRSLYLKPGCESDYVFPSNQGNRLDNKYIHKRIERYCQIAEIDHHVSSHVFRRSFATHLLEQGVDIRYVQKLLGHKKIDTTMNYIKVTVKDLHSVLLRCHPREKVYERQRICFKGVQRYEYVRKSTVA